MDNHSRTETVNPRASDAVAEPTSQGGETRPAKCARAKKRLRFEQPKHSAYDRYVGSAEALQGTGLVAKHQLPGQPNRQKTVMAYARDGSEIHGYSAWYAAAEPGSVHLRRLSADGYELLVIVSEQEQRVRLEAQRESLAKARAEVNAVRTLQAHSVDLTPAQYRQRNDGFAAGLLSALRKSFSSPQRGGFDVDDASYEKLEVAIEQLLSIVHNVRLQFDPAKHASACAAAGISPLAIDAGRDVVTRGTLRLVSAAQAE